MFVLYVVFLLILYVFMCFCYMYVYIYVHSIYIYAYSTIIIVVNIIFVVLCILHCLYMFFVICMCIYIYIDIYIHMYSLCFAALRGGVTAWCQSIVASQLFEGLRLRELQPSQAWARCYVAYVSNIFVVLSCPPMQWHTVRFPQRVRKYRGSEAT